MSQTESGQITWYQSTCWSDHVTFKTSGSPGVHGVRARVSDAGNGGQLQLTSEVPYSIVILGGIPLPPSDTNPKREHLLELWDGYTFNRRGRSLRARLRTWVAPPLEVWRRTTGRKPAARDGETPVTWSARCCPSGCQSVFVIVRGWFQLTTRKAVRRTFFIEAERAERLFPDVGPPTPGLE